MNDHDLALKHAIERYSNAAFEQGLADRQHNDAVARVAKTGAALVQAAKDLIELAGTLNGSPKYIRQGDKVIIVSSRGVEIGNLTNV